MHGYENTCVNNYGVVSSSCAYHEGCFVKLPLPYAAWSEDASIYVSLLAEAGRRHEVRDIESRGGELLSTTRYSSNALQDLLHSSHRKDNIDHNQINDE